jgi:hypothetical protein
MCVCYAVVLTSSGLCHHSSKQRNSVLLTQLHRLHCVGWDTRLQVVPFMQGQRAAFAAVAAQSIIIIIIMLPIKP